MQNNQPGISFIEILVILLLIAISMSFVIPRFITNRPGIQQKKFFADFASMVSDTMYQAITSKTTHQIFFDFDHHIIIVKKHQPIPDESNQHKHFIPLAQSVFHSRLTIPDFFTIRNFIVQAEEQMKSGMTMHDAWFYIMPDGTSQATILNIEDDSQDTPARFSITINPFYSQATLHDTFQK